MTKQTSALPVKLHSYSFRNLPMAQQVKAHQSTGQMGVNPEPWTQNLEPLSLEILKILTKKSRHRRLSYKMPAKRSAHYQSFSRFKSNFFHGGIIAGTP